MVYHLIYSFKKVKLLYTIHWNIVTILNLIFEFSKAFDMVYNDKSHNRNGQRFLQ